MRAAYDVFVVQGVSLADRLKLPLTYAVALAFAFLTIHVLLPGFFRPRRIQDVPLTARTLRREISWGALTLVLSGAISMLTVWLVMRGAIAVRLGPVSA